jgi:MFS family permease
VISRSADPKPAGKNLSRGATLAMVALCAAVFVAALDMTMVLTIMPDIMRSLYIDVRNLNDAGWIITAYLLGYTVAMPLFGRLADVRGRRPMTMVALGLFLIGSALCVFLSRLDLFVVARVIQAAGGGALVPIAMAAAADMYPLSRRGLVLGIIGGAAEAGGVLGPMYGVGLSLAWSWRLIFIVNIPLCLVLMPLCWWLLRPAASPSYPDTSAGMDDEAGDAATPPMRAAADVVGPAPLASAKHAGMAIWRRLRGGRVDYIGAALMALSLAGVTIGLGTGTTMASTGTGNTAQTGGAVRWQWLVGAAIAFALFLVWERRLHRPLIRLELFRKPPFAAANVAHLLVGAALIIGMVEIPLYAYTLFGMSLTRSGLLLMELTGMIPVGAVLGGMVADYIGYRAVAVLGFLVACGGFLLVSRWSLHPGGWLMLRDLFISGFGFGLVVGPIGATATHASGTRWMTTGSALVTVSRMVGMVLALSALSAWGVRRYNALTQDLVIPIVRPAGLTDSQWQATKDAAGSAIDNALHTVFSNFFLIAAIIIGLAVIPALFFYNKREQGESKIPFLPR